MRNIIKRSAIIVLLGLGSFFSSYKTIAQVSDNSFGAFSKTSSNNQAGWSWGYETPEEAIKKAEEKCSSDDCETVLLDKEFPYLAYAEDSHGYWWGYSGGNTRDNASNTAIETCEAVDETQDYECIVRLILHSDEGPLYENWVYANTPSNSNYEYYDGSSSYSDTLNQGGLDPTSDEAHYNWESCGDWSGC